MAKADKRTGDRHQNTGKMIRFRDEQLAILEAIKAKNGGTYADAIAAAGSVYLQANKTDWPAELERLARELRERAK